MKQSSGSKNLIDLGSRGPYSPEDVQRARNCMNLDCLPKEEVEWFCTKFAGLQGANAAAARILFPDEPLAASMVVVEHLATYAMNKSQAMTARLDGMITDAVRLENVCDKIYLQLPEYAKW